MQALIGQFLRDRELFNFGASDSLYIGGGTPSIVAHALYKPLFQAISPFLNGDAEVTIEANPNSLTLKWAEGIRAIGANRISIGAQSFDNQKLRFLGRLHNGSEAQEAIKNAKNAGFSEINVDLIYGVLGDTRDLLRRDLRTALECGATHISAYTLTVEKNSAFYGRSDVAITDEKTERQFCEAIEAAGLPRYEVSNFGKNPSRHNMGYWAGKDYLGIGSGATGTVKEGENRLRYEPHKKFARYINDPFYKKIETIDQETFRAERLMLGARCKIGFDRFLLNLREQQKAEVLLKEGLLAMRGDRYYNTDFRLADEIWLFLNG
jgi:oxygen-independent coproporphyrinogen-3 oxidase